MTDNRGPVKNQKCKDKTCVKDKTPDMYDPTGKYCAQFQRFKWTKESDWIRVHHVKIRYKHGIKGKKKHYTAKCFPPHKSVKYGWCNVTWSGKDENRDRFNRQKGSNEAHISYGNIHEDWGYCSSSCEKEKSTVNKLQEAQYTVIPNEDCDLFAKVSRIYYHSKKDFCTGMTHNFERELTFKRTWRKKTDENGKRIYEYVLLTNETAYGSVNPKQRKLDYYIGFSDQCGGDSGGPFFYFDDKNRAIQTGIVGSGSEQCGALNHPGIMTKVPYFIKWIHKNTKGASC